MTGLREAGLEGLVLGWLVESGWSSAYGPDLAPGEPSAERSDYREVLLLPRLRAALARLNPGLPSDALDAAVSDVSRPESQMVFSENWRAFRLLVEGVPVEYRTTDGSLRYARARMVDWEDVAANDWLAVNQFTVKGQSSTRRADVVLFVNGLPLVLMELKRPGQEGATVRGALNQVQTYVEAVPELFTWNQVVVISDGVQARAGAFTAGWEHYAPWKTIHGDGVVKGRPEIETLVRGMFEPARFLDLLRNFVVFADEASGPSKKVAKYHQYWAVTKAVDCTVEATEGDGRAGVVWHTQGSGKSLEMLCFAGKVMRHQAMENPTLVVITDRNDLDDQLFAEVFATARPNAPLPDLPVQAESREHLKDLLEGRQSGGVLFTTIQKFGLTQADRAAGRSFPLLSERTNVVVMVDEAHRSNYDFVDGFARHLRDALPNATYIGFTGTPIESTDRSTVQVFGEYIDVYDLTQAVEDGATVKVFYEPRLAKVDFPSEALAELDAAFEDATSGTEEEARERLKTRWARVEAIVGSETRIKQLAADIVEHWEARREVLAGKAMIVAMSRRIAAALYDEIVALRPDWHSADDDLGKVKVVITGSADDAPALQPHIRSKERQRALKARAKNPADELELVIVRDMWLTGFDSPSMHTMYVDKPMRGAPLMQAIARVNRTFKDKPSGLVVDYIGIAEDLQTALADYTQRDRDSQGLGQDLRTQAIPALVETHGIVTTILHGHPWRETLRSGGDRAFLETLTSTVEYLLAQHPGPEAQPCSAEQPCLKHRFLHQARRLVSLYAMCVPSDEALAIRDDVAFFEAVRGQIAKIEGTDRRVDPSAEIDTAIKQIVSDAIASGGVVDIYAEAGLARPDLSLIDEEFIEKVRRSDRPNLQIEMLRRLLGDEIARIGRTRLVKGREFSEMLNDSIRRYQNRSLDSAQVIAELVDLARHLKGEAHRGADLGLREDELAFYDAISTNESAVLELGDDTLKTIAIGLVAIVRRDAKTDWAVKEQVRAQLRRNIKRLLRKHRYPPDQQERAVGLVLRQAEVIADQWSGSAQDEWMGSGDTGRRDGGPDADPDRSPGTLDPGAMRTREPGD